MNKTLSYSLLLGLLTLLLASCGGKTYTVRLIQTTDVHGNIWGYDDVNERAGSGGYARLSSFLKAQQDSNLLLVDVGDFLQGEPITYYSNYIDTLQPNAIARAMNLLGYDAAVVGNHDIEPGHAVYDKFQRELKAPLLGGNVINTETNQPYFLPYKIIERGGIRIAIIGMTTPAIPEWVPEENWKGMRFLDIEETLPVWVKKVREEEHADVVVAALHSGLEGQPQEVVENAVRSVAEHVTGIDAILYGHDHRKNLERIQGKEKEVVIINPSNHLDWVGDLTFTVKKDAQGAVSSVKVSAELKSLESYEPDEDFLKQFDKLHGALSNFLDKRLGLIDQEIQTADALFGSSSYMTLMHQMQLETMEAEISFAAPLSTRSMLEAGEVSMRDLFKLCPFTNYLYVMELTGREITGYLNYSYQRWASPMKAASDHLILLKEDAKPEDRYKTMYPTYNYSSALGVDYRVDLSLDPIKVYVFQRTDGTPLEQDRRYRVVLNSYRAGGAGGMLTEGAGIPRAELKGRIIAQSSHDQLYNMMNYFLRKGVVSAKVIENWAFTPSKWTADAAARDRAFLFPQQ